MRPLPEPGTILLLEAGVIDFTRIRIKLREQFLWSQTVLSTKEGGGLGLKGVNFVIMHTFLNAGPVRTGEVVLIEEKNQEQKINNSIIMTGFQLAMLFC